MLHITVDDERRLRNSVRQKVSTLLKKYGIDEIQNKETSSEDQFLIDDIAFYLFIMAKNYKKGFDIPENGRMDESAVKTLGRDKLEQRIDAALIQALGCAVHNDAQESLRSGNIFSVLDSMEKNSYIAVPRLVLDKDKSYVEGYQELKAIFYILLDDLDQLPDNNETLVKK